MQKSAKPDCIITEFYAVALGPVLKIGGSFIWIVVFYLFTNYDRHISFLQFVLHFRQLMRDVRNFSECISQICSKTFIWHIRVR